ncbi:hypothetical protein JT070_01450 [Helicobacter pylori]|nr:hypothetical protein [Helicobacter pylori]
MLFLRFPLLASHFYASWHAPYLDLPHILTMGRDEILQQTRFKLFNATTLKNALSSLKINHKIPIPTI